MNLFSFLKMLELIVQEPGTAFRSLLPQIIAICMDHIYPLVAQVSHASSKVTKVLALKPKNPDVAVSRTGYRNFSENPNSLGCGWMPPFWKI